VGAKRFVIPSEAEGSSTFTKKGKAMAVVYRITKQDDGERVFLNGKINEDAGGPLNDLLEKIGAKCILNLRDIDEVNSLGVRLWVNFMREFETKRTVILEECPPEVIRHINIIPNFKGKSTIRSLYARYICDHCGNKKLELFKLGEKMPKKLGQEFFLNVTCQSCGQKMEMEELENEFFACVIG
jgi:hypothetical protein